MSAIIVENLKKYFGTTRAVDGISLHVEPGEIFGFLGPNGAGKTTTIRCLLDFLRPTAGRIEILGKDARRDSVALKKKIGFLSSDVHLYDNWNGEDHLRFIKRLRKSENLPSDLLKNFGLDLKMKTRKLSTGNRQKLGILMAFVGEPELMILDEPTRGLDPILQNEMYKLLRSWQARGRTVFMSSHNLSEVDHLCSRVGIIKSGKLAAIENLDTLKEKRIHLVTATFTEPIQVKEFEEAGLAITHANTHQIIGKVHGDLTPVIQAVSRHKVADLEITHATLEEVFLEFYNNHEQ